MSGSIRNTTSGSQPCILLHTPSEISFVHEGLYEVNSQLLAYLTCLYFYIFPQRVHPFPFSTIFFFKGPIPLPIIFPFIEVSHGKA